MALTAEALTVSRQVISKWKIGTTVPDINSILSISKIFRVSIDYLVNDKLDIEEDLPSIKATSKTTKKYIWIRIISIFCIITFFISLG